MDDNLDQNVLSFMLSIPIFTVGIMIIFFILKMIYELISYAFSLIVRLIKGIFSLIEGTWKSSIDFLHSNQDYILSTEFLTHGLAVIGGVYLASHLFIPFCKLVDSLMEIIVVLPFMMIGWAYDILRGTFLFTQKALVRPWNPDYDNGAPSFENRGLNS